MAIKDYTQTELTYLVLTQANKIRGLRTEFEPEDSNSAYDEACRECGFELPATDDADKRLKYQWLIHRMRRWYIFQLWQQNVQFADNGDFKAQQIVKNCDRIVTKLDADFETAKTAEDSAHLFLDAGTVFGVPLVVGTGFIEDRIGETTQDEIDNRSV